MTGSVHPNLALLKKLDIRNLDACKNVFSDDFTWHYFNSKLPELEGSHQGVEGLKKFFTRLNERSNSSFQEKVIDVRSAGDELVITQVCNHMDLEGRSIEFDAIVVWRVVNDKITEAWDIPAINTVRAG